MPLPQQIFRQDFQIPSPPTNKVYDEVFVTFAVWGRRINPAGSKKLKFTLKLSLVGDELKFKYTGSNPPDFAFDSVAGNHNPFGVAAIVVEDWIKNKGLTPGETPKKYNQLKVALLGDAAWDQDMVVSPTGGLTIAEVHQKSGAALNYIENWSLDGTTHNSFGHQYSAQQLASQFIKH
jgi:hypothetical protein